jgi:5-methyltetrahydrofolate corrinoid/iron sulfur protein methyltransferase
MIVIGEKINATRAAVRDIIEARREGELAALACEQAAVGASYIDVNVGTGRGTRDDEIAAMQWAVTTLCAATDKPLCIDSADAAVLEAGLEAMAGRPAMINSVKADSHCLGEVLPLAARFLALAMDDRGIPKDVQGRLDACRRIVAACADFQIPVEQIFFDPLVLPVSTDAVQGKVTLDTLAAIRQTFPGAHATMGLSNISFGLPGRAALNAAFLHMAVYAGLDSAIMDPSNTVMMAAVRGAEALMGKDRHFRRYTRAMRKSS